MVAVYRPLVKSIVVTGNSASLELRGPSLATDVRGCWALPYRCHEVRSDGAIVVGTPQSSPFISGLKLESRVVWPWPEGFRIVPSRVVGRAVIVIASDWRSWSAYGVFHFLRLMQTLAANKPFKH